jgi:hypothetical protein
MKSDPPMRDAFYTLKDNLMSLRWSICVWLALSAGSWFAAYAVISLIV